MALTDVQVRNAKPQGKQYKLTDGLSMYLLVTPAGGKRWVLKYRFSGKEKSLALGTYPEVSIVDARKRRDEAREKLAAGIDPSDAKKADKRAAKVAALNTFEAVATAWLDEWGQTVTPASLTKKRNLFASDVFPKIGSRPVTEIEAPEILAVLRGVDGRGVRYTANRLTGDIARVFKYAVQNGVCKHNPARELTGVIPAAEEKHHAAITDPVQVGAMLRTFDSFTGTFPVRCALDLAPMLFVRPGELRQAEWSHFDLDKAEWRYIATKTNTAHIVPLARQAVAILRELYLVTGNGRYVFPGARDRKRAMSENTVNAALKRLGFDTQNEITGHGFRAMARTILSEDEALLFDPEYIERQLAHKTKTANGEAYDRAKYLKQRREMMQKWADYLDQIKAGAQVIRFAAAGGA
ncbi:tyrosine-type recombinase/integrase [Burkholderia vietnamiensis]|uniref:tyrosine-type recombinase/integrase n=1 Tax=Burkholderia vietnamiensis TaxID=60552 RepID=UPI001B9268DD|nr:integrase arm-type DNA-binding domain-containing protein [Burkholderia vietnamiensis]MBR8032434.1 integrase arm-type DNA-binding domain-containing protein [Burkholderia vietnamiensis]